MTKSITPEIAKRDVRQRRSLMAQTFLRLLGRKGALVGCIWIAITATLAAWAPLLANSRPLAWRYVDPQRGPIWQFPAFEMLTPQDVMFLAGFLLGIGALACFRAGGKVFWVYLAAMCATFAGSMAFHLIDQHQQLNNAITSNFTIYQKQANNANRLALDSSWWSLAWWWVRWSLLALGVVAIFTLSLFRLRMSKAWLLVALLLSTGILTVMMVPMFRVEPTGISAPGYDFYRQAIKDGRAKNAYFAIIPYSPNDDLPEQTTVKPDELQVGVRNNLRRPGKHPVIPDIAQEMQVQAEALYGIRLYELKDEQGKDIPTPDNIQSARNVGEVLWRAYQQRNSSNPERGEVIYEQVRNLFDRFEQITPQTRTHVMGTTYNGQDLASRMIHGSRIALYIGFISTGIAVVIGVIIGGIMGYFSGWVDLIGLQLVEIFASIPVIMLLIMIVAFYGRSLELMMVVLGLTGWVGYAYFVRAEFLKLRKMDYVLAARATGTPLHLILFKHMLPNGVAPVLVGASFGIAGAIMTEATLSFLGLGLEPTESSWGQMLNQARQGGSFAWWLAIFPGSAIFLTVFAYNLIGEALRDVIDPRAVK